MPRFSQFTIFAGAAALGMYVLAALLAREAPDVHAVPAQLHSPANHAHDEGQAGDRSPAPLAHSDAAPAARPPHATSHAAPEQPDATRQTSAAAILAANPELTESMRAALYDEDPAVVQESAELLEELLRTIEAIDASRAADAARN